MESTQKLACYLFSETLLMEGGAEAITPEALSHFYEEGINQKSLRVIDHQCGAFLAEWASAVLATTPNRDLVQIIIRSSLPLFCMIYKEEDQFAHYRSEAFSLIGSVFSVSED